MKKLVVLIGWIILISSQVYSQNNFLIGETVYPCTEEFSLTQNSEFMYEPVNFIFAKNKETVMLVVSIKVMGGGVRIKGNLIIYLDDNSIITCKDSGKFDYVDQIATTIYTVTNQQLNKFKTVNINKIRYTLKCFDCKFSSEEGTFTATNAPSDLQYSYGQNLEKPDFPKAINSLFE